VCDIIDLGYLFWHYHNSGTIFVLLGVVVELEVRSFHNLIAKVMCS